MAGLCAKNVKNDEAEKRQILPGRNVRAANNMQIVARETREDGRCHSFSHAPAIHCKPQLKRSRTCTSNRKSGLNARLDTANAMSIRDFDSAGSALTTSRRVELSRQQTCVDFDHQTFPLRPTFRTAPSARPAIQLDASADDSPRRPRTASATDPAPPQQQQVAASPVSALADKTKKKVRKTVSFQAVEPSAICSSSARTTCGCCDPSAADRPVSQMASPIHTAVRRQDYSALKHLTSFYVGSELVALVNSHCSCGRTPLDVACEVADARIVKLLLKRHADPNVRDATTDANANVRKFAVRPRVAVRPRGRRSCVAVACRLRNLEILTLLLQAGGHIDEEALVLAAGRGHTDVLTVLVTHADAAGRKKASPVHQLFHKRRSSACASADEPILSTSARVKACSAAVASDHANLIPILLGDRNGPLTSSRVVRCAFDAVALPDLRLLRCLFKSYGAALLLEARAAGSRESLLHAAVKSSSTKCALFLLRSGAAVAAVDGNGVPPLYVACARGQEPIVSALLKGGATCLSVGPGGETPLHIAAQENQLKCVQLLLETGRVDVDQATQDGCTALHLAAQRGNTAVAACLLDHGADVDALTTQSESPLLKASRMSHFQTVKLLVERQAAGPRAPEEDVELKMAKGVQSAASFASMTTAESTPKLPRRRSWSAAVRPEASSQRGSSVLRTTHLGLKHWLRTVLKS
ncbi:hypothetical protein BBJ28_00013435 [Nothophytophthora sp. Chile5]|nr:hypothetical protein BBJ28_00013435 [Nothophytophthora sp. Chile5]